MSGKKNTAAMILAAGQGTRMKSALPKVLHRVAGRPMLWYAANLARQVATQTVAIVVGHGSEQVQAYLEQEKANFEPFEVVIQEKQLGTGHAVQQAYPVCTRNDAKQADQFLILNGDSPLLTQATLTSLVDYHQSEKAGLTILTTVIPESRGYGRVVRGPSGEIRRVVEDQDCSAEERSISEINVGTYVVDGTFLGKALSQLRPQNAQGEYYITDMIEVAVQEGLKVVAWITNDHLETTGINTREHLAIAEKEMRRRICQRLMLSGVTMLDPERVIIDDGVEVGRDTSLYPGVILEGRTVLGANCVIHANSRLNNCLVGNNVLIQDSCVLLEARIEEGAVIGPFAHLRPGSHIHRKGKVGNFVELKQTEVGEGSKVNHLSYLGDTVIGRNVNIGAGTITCNYDGFRKARTQIEDNVFIGSDVQLIAPVTIGEGALIAAGTTVTKNVPPNALGISRVAQVNKEGTAAKRREILASSSAAHIQDKEHGDPAESSLRPNPQQQKDPV
ncbi:MAG TPA: bifunctional UDP-N-acetylglucosamine diphosphorylase/glucosamine-1-phosphate N-acetyltransferase GlmU [Nitrospirales bacterium]|nr:bifunctional UDP-N-acetylglucosamine diphosphorylase/glucosamine-1-phosphate N-acetyltransferase GlmU [Nitrospirales bacterium]